MQNADKVKRMEEEYNRRLSEWQIKLQKANETSIKYDSEINFLKEKMHSLDAEARSKLESIKQRVQEEEQRKSMSILRGFENKLKATEEEKRQHERRSEQLSKEMDRLGIFFLVLGKNC
jgi:chromosome segregation ATPase